MRQGSFLVVLILVFASSVNADIVESFNVGSPFVAGIPGLDPGAQITLANSFDTSPLTGSVEARDPRSILAGGGNVAFTAQAGGSTEIHFDLGAGIEVSSLPSAVLVDSEIMMNGIDSSTFSFLFTAQFVDGSPIIQISDLGLSATMGSLVLTGQDAGLFRADLTGNTGSSDVAISTVSGGILRAIQFRSIIPESELDVLTVSGTRTLFTPVPEPSSMIFLGLIGILIASGRRKST